MFALQEQQVLRKYYELLKSSAPNFLQNPQKHKADLQNCKLDFQFVEERTGVVLNISKHQHFRQLFNQASLSHKGN